jgi:prepilin signal peptidase PulO-like enzyme (type II secretory pathway)
MLEILLFVVALIGSTTAGLYDLKTTEIPDEIPYIMMIIGIIGNIIKSYLVWSYWPFLTSMIVGLGFLGFGFFMYYLGQWGGGDAKILSAIGFLVPVLPHEFKVSFIFPFPISFFFNVFLVGAAYMIIYALFLSVINRKIWSAFFEDLKANAKIIFIFNILLIIFMVIFGITFAKIFQTDMVIFSVMIIVITSGFFLLWKFVKTVENVGFKRKIPMSQLRVGDVPLDYKVWEGITEKELKKIKSSGKRYIWIKEGVRFAPAFPLALIFTILVGDGIIWFLRLYV